MDGFECEKVPWSELEEVQVMECGEEMRYKWKQLTEREWKG